MDLLVILSDAGRGALGPVAAIYALAAVGLNLHFGYTGLLNFGQVAFMLVGAYGVAVTVAVYGGPLWLGVLVGLAASVVLALLLGIPTLRLRADYLAIATIAAGEVLRIVFNAGFARPVTGGVFGLQQFAGAFYTANPVPAGSYGLGRLDLHRPGPVGDAGRLGRGGGGHAGPAPARPQPVGTGPAGSPGRRGGGAQPRQERLRLQDAEPRPRRAARRARRDAARDRRPGGGRPTRSTPWRPSTCTRCSSSAAPEPSSARSSAAVVFWFLLSFADSALRQAIGAGVVPQQVIEPADVGAVRFALVGLGLVILLVFRPAGILGNREEMRLEAGATAGPRRAGRRTRRPGRARTEIGSSR